VQILVRKREGAGRLWLPSKYSVCQRVLPDVIGSMLKRVAAPMKKTALRVTQRRPLFWSQCYASRVLSYSTYRAILEPVFSGTYRIFFIPDPGLLCRSAIGRLGSLGPALEDTFLSCCHCNIVLPRVQNNCHLHLQFY
jgi:hypothetical protein